MKYIALLRGINVGRYRKIRMADLRQLFEKMGYTNVQTYIQTGNVIFYTEQENIQDELQNNIEEAILTQFGFDVPTVVLTHNEIEQIVTNNPFLLQNSELSDERLHVSFLHATPTEECKLSTSEKQTLPDKYILHNTVVYIFCTATYSQSKLGNTFFENNLEVKATTRNWKTTKKILTLCNEQQHMQ